MPRTLPASGAAAARPPRSTLRYPTLAAHAPVIRRGCDELQVGLDPRTAVVLTGPGFEALLSAMDGRTKLDAVVAAGRAAGLAGSAVAGMIDLLTDAGLVDDARPPRFTRPPGWTVRLVGAGPIGRDVAQLLVASGVGELYVFDDNSPERATYPCAGVLPSRAEALGALLDDPIAMVHPVSHWSRPNRRVDLTVVVADGPEVDRIITDHLLRGDEPHLLVRSLGASVIVGPLVRPGRTSCLHCHDLARRDADPQWSTVLDQLCRIEVQSKPVVASWAASVAAAQALSFLGGTPAELENCTYEMGAPDYAVQLRTWPAHPDCGCAWLGPTQWGP